MPRNAEVVRQWNILREIEKQRQGVTIATLAEHARVTTRTIRRDLDALQQAGFPLYDDRESGEVRWKLNAQALRGLEPGFTLSELSALHFSRALLESLAGSPFRTDLERAFARLESVLSPRMRRFLDKLPGVISARPESAPRKQAAQHEELVASLVRATIEQRKTAMRYHSFSSDRVKDYQIDPYRLIYGQGGLYLFAFVPEYNEMRTFAVERIRRLSVLEERYEGHDDLPADPSPHSLGMFQGDPETVRVEFDSRVAPYIRERVWHASQEIREQSGGSVMLTLRVATDWSLRRFILGFGPFARVVEPAALAAQIVQDLDEARRRYEASDPT
jgi:predicted DNA-binding transcriptional regulator YafY